MNRKDKILGCLLGGAIGDAMGHGYEQNESVTRRKEVFVWGGEEEKEPEWELSDDTQLTLATAESLVEEGQAIPGKIAEKMLEWFVAGRFSGLGSATLQALQGLRAGGHWAVVGKRGEYAAGNGAAMRIAPLACLQNPPDARTLRDICRITHHSEEAYAGAWAVFHAIRQAISSTAPARNQLAAVAEYLPDSRVRDRLIELSALSETNAISDIAEKYGCSDYVVESVPLALFAAQKADAEGIDKVLPALVQCGGDADTNASICGQIAGAKIGAGNLPAEWTGKISRLSGASLLWKLADRLN